MRRSGEIKKLQSVLLEIIECLLAAEIEYLLHVPSVEPDSPFLLIIPEELFDTGRDMALDMPLVDRQWNLLQTQVHPGSVTGKIYGEE